MTNLDAIFKSAITKIVACGYVEEVAMKAILRSGICYGCKDTVSNIVDNALTFRKNGQEIDPSREHYFEYLQQLKYILAELVCVLQEVRPFFSAGDAMWCLLICDMNVSHACAMDGDPLSSFVSDSATDGCSSAPTESQSNTEIKGPELSLPSPCKSTPSGPNISQSEAHFTSGVPAVNNLKSSQIFGGLQEKEVASSKSDFVDKPLVLQLDEIPFWKDF